jgi:uncharacterized membrane protein YdjX (TVP38/TMEM64 family)
MRSRLSTSFLARFDDRLRMRGVVTIGTMRLVLFMIAPLNWWMGATGIRARDYVVGTAIGIVPWLVGILIAVKTLGSINSVKDLIRGDVFAVIAGAGAVVVVVGIARQKLVARSRSTAGEPA